MTIKSSSTSLFLPLSNSMILSLSLPLSCTHSILFSTHQLVVLVVLSKCFQIRPLLILSTPSGPACGHLPLGRSQQPPSWPPPAQSVSRIQSEIMSRLYSTPSHSHFTQNKIQTPCHALHRPLRPGPSRWSNLTPLFIPPPPPHGLVAAS